jgi:O-antigen biosynthesis protein
MPVVNDYTALLSGNYWNGIEVTGSPVIVTFSFPTTAPAYDSTVSGFTAATAATFVPFTAAEQAQAVQALSEWAAASGLIFVEVAPGQGDINFQNVDFSTTSYGEAAGVGFYPFGDWNNYSYPNFTSDLDASGDVFMNSQYIGANGNAPDSVNYGTLLHEIGHAIGLKHPTEDVVDYAAEPPVDHNQVLASNDPSLTIMATVEDSASGGADAHLKMLDMQAAADLYGPAGTGGVYTGTTSVTQWSWNATTETLTQTPVGATASGVNSVSQWSWNPATQTLTQTALTADEMVRGTSVNDVIIGMSGDRLFALNGDDTLQGAGGDDSLYGGSGTDMLIGGPGGNSFYVNSPATVIDDSAGSSDTAYSSVSFMLPHNVDTLYVYGQGLTGQGNSQYDSLFGDGTNGTTLIGGSGGDYMVGGAGNDTFEPGTGPDLMYGQAGDNDFVFRSAADAPVGPNPTTIADFVQGADKIDLSAITGADGQPLTFIGTSPFSHTDGEVRQVTSGSDTIVEGDLNGDGNADFEIELIGNYTLQTDDFAGSTAPCYCAGTRIRTDIGETPVEELAIGDLVVTHSAEVKPIKWIGRRSYSGRFIAGSKDVLPIRIAAGAIDDKIPARDLRLSPEHALFLDGVLVPARHLINGSSIIQEENVESVEYFHIELAVHDVILAEDTPAETFVDDDSRMMFNNAAEFCALYPGEERVPALYCAPRVEDGYELEAIRRRLAARARWLAPDGTATAPSEQGWLDLAQHDLIEGWAFDPANPAAAVTVIILANGAEIARLVADRYRPDLAEAGIGDGRHAFSYAVPGGLAIDASHTIEVFSASRAARLPGSPVVVPALAVSRDASTPLGTLHGNIDRASHDRIAGWAQDAAEPERPVGLVVIANGQVIARLLANRYRADLVAIGSGRHAFELMMPSGTLSALEDQCIRIVREADGTELAGSPVILPTPRAFDATARQTLASLLARVNAGADEDEALAFLTQEADRLLSRRALRQSGRDAREALRLHRRRWGRPPTDEDPVVPGNPRALVVDDRMPCASRDAGSVAILSHIGALQTLGYEVSFVAAEEMVGISGRAALAAQSVVLCGSPYYSCVEDVLVRQAGTFDLVYLHRLTNVDRYLTLARQHQPNARIVYSVADLHHLRQARQARVEARPELLAFSRRTAASEILAARRADIVITHSPVEAELLRRQVGFGKVHVVPFAVPRRTPRRSFAERHGIAFIGSHAHAPNPDAVHYLVRNILPLVWQHVPEVTCTIVGHGWAPERLPAFDPRVQLFGAIDDLETVFGTVRLTVAPLRFGAGIKGKVLDSFAAGLPCVMTPIAAEGLPLPAGLLALIADTPAAFAKLIRQYHDDEAANKTAGVEAEAMVAREFNRQSVVRCLGAALASEAAYNLADDRLRLPGTGDHCNRRTPVAERQIEFR